MSDSNAMIIRKVYQDFARGDISAVFAAFDASIAWHVPGHSPLSGDYNGHDQIGGFFRRTMELSGGAFSIGAGTSQSVTAAIARPATRSNPPICDGLRS
jgi:ketosteroid isomerase-like protein